MQAKVYVQSNSDIKSPDHDDNVRKAACESSKVRDHL